MAVIIGFVFLIGSCAAYKIHNWTATTTGAAVVVDTKTCKKLLYGALSLMSLALFALSGDVHSATKSNNTSTVDTNGDSASRGSSSPSTLPLLLLEIRGKAVAVALLCIFMFLYSVGVRPTVATLEQRFVGQQTSDTGMVLYKALSTITFWLAVPLLILLFLTNWSHIGWGWILTLFAFVCLLAIMYVAIFIPNGEEEEEVDGDEGDSEDGQGNSAIGEEVA